MSEIKEWMDKNYPKERFTPGFERLDRAFEIFNLNFSKTKKITVAGTNGKGTVARLIYQNLKLNKKVCALFTSPHLISITERFSFSDSNTDEENLLSTFKHIHSSLKKNEIDLSFYEFTFVVFLKICEEKKVEFIVLEVGLGGRLDATNKLDANYSIVTSIARDHVEFLGNSFKSILNEKIAIAKKGSLFISSFENKYLYQIASDYCLKNEIKSEIEFSNKKISLRNEYCLKALFDSLKLEVFTTQLDFISAHNQKLIFSCCHNLSAVRNLVQYFMNVKPKINRPIMLISYSHRDFKELEYMSKLFLKLRPFVDRIYLTHIDQFKAAREQDIKYIANELDIPFADKKKIDEVISENKNIYLSGSNYFVGDFINRYFN